VPATPTLTTANMGGKGGAASGRGKPRGPKPRGTADDDAGAAAAAETGALAAAVAAAAAAPSAPSAAPVPVSPPAQDPAPPAPADQDPAPPAPAARAPGAARDAAAAAGQKYDWARFLPAVVELMASGVAEPSASVEVLFAVAQARVPGFNAGSSAFSAQVAEMRQGARYLYGRADAIPARDAATTDAHLDELMSDETLWQEDALKKQYFKHIRSIQKDAPTTRAFIKNLMLLRPKWPKGTARAKDTAADAAPKRPRPAVNISAASSSVVVVSESGVTGSGSHRNLRRWRTTRFAAPLAASRSSSVRNRL